MRTDSTVAEEINRTDSRSSGSEKQPVESTSVSRWHLLLLLFVLLLSLGLRLYRIGDQGLFSDEAKSWAMTRLSFVEIVQISPTQHHVPLYFWLLKAALTILPASEAGLRALSLIMSMAALAVFMVFLWHEWSQAAAVYAGLLLAISSFDVYYAQETRMYTLLSFLGLVSYVALVKALQGRPKWLVPWALACIGLAWTHFYGFLPIASQLVIVLVYLVRRQPFGIDKRLSSACLLAACVCVALGVLPVVVSLFARTSTSAQGAVLPDVTHIRDLFLLWTAGLVSVREHFLDSARLTWPLTKEVSKTAWFLLGAVLYGAPAVYGLAKAWRVKGTQRLQVSLALASFVMPVLLIFVFANVTQNKVWIFRGFLGQNLLVFMWAGIGLASWRRQWLSQGIVGAAVILAVFSLGPYFTIWQKSDVPLAVATAHRPDARNQLAVEAPFFGPQVSFYLDKDTPLFSLFWDETGAPLLTRLQFTQPRRLLDKAQGTPLPVTCDDISGITDLWIYGSANRIRSSVEKLPSCVTNKRIWVFNRTEWVPLDLSQ